MRVLIVTEKCGAPVEQRDGGARLVESLARGFGGRADIMQFATEDDRETDNAKWCYRYPIAAPDRFSRRMANADFIADRVREVVSAYTHVIFVHVSMQFGFDARSAPSVRTWTFPMFLTPSYAAAGERVPESYTQMERQVLTTTDRILTPSHLERTQLLADYHVASDQVRVVPRGVNRLHVVPKRRAIDGPPRFCSVGSIKRQKNTIGLVRLFHAIRERYPKAHLRIIGPVQDRAPAGVSKP